ncbi:TonB-dependent receptor [Erythrobacter sp. SG61-1L]|uniref:TonB-dependent receptor n=1 Tax=Erythrobacter sp. SG61-1L TaxID=1603897 RepID=UPI0006C90272|nr:TonB-dependent receptor [Erythrobacter sp. SG61-1L]KPL69723.1 TonB-dependent receptor [Erythrobacter sp. SG61-1L]KPL69824.1 TonB-dependent receptor [Erythrobacter sp. SG61-1L]
MTITVSGRATAIRATLLLGAAGLALAVPSVAFAQAEEELAQPAEDEPGSGNEILVTATKREQTLQDVPVAVTVATGEALERAQIRDLKDLQTLVPSLRVTQLQSSANTNFIIRGFGNGANNAGIEPSVGVFIDGVYRSRTASQVNDLPNVSRIEVLRGPQSTLFGKNASAGVISIVTEEPQFDLGGSVEAGYGNYNAVVLKGYVTGPLSENVAASIAGGWSGRDGYNKDLGTGDRTNERNRWFVRGQLLIEPSTDFKARIIADYDSIDENCCGVINLKRAPSPGATDVIDALGDLPDANHPFANVVYNNYNSTNDIKNWGVSAQLDYNVGPMTLTSITAFRNNQAVTAQDADFSSADLIYPLAADINLDTFTQELRMTAEIADKASILLGAFYIKEKVDQTGELKWGSQARAYANALISSLSGGSQNIATLEGTLGTLEGDPSKYTNKFFAYQTGNDETFTLDSEAISIFGQIDYEVVPGLTLTVGGNYTKDVKDYTANIVGSDAFSTVDLVADGNTAIYAQALATTIGGPMFLNLNRPATQEEIGLFAQGNPLAFGLASDGAHAYADANDTDPAVNSLLALKPLQYLPPFLNVPNSVEDGHVSDDDFTYTIRLAYDVSPEVNIYASYATGFKAASVNLSRDSRPLASDAAALGSAGLLKVNQTYGTRYADPEKSTVYEFGLKGNWGVGSANVAVFKQEIQGFQSNIFTGTGFALANAGKQSTFGVEFEGMVEPTDGLTFNLGVTYLDPKYDDFKFSAVGDLTGTKPAGIPEWTVVLGGQYEIDMGNGDALFLNASYHHESEVQIVEGLPGYIAGGQAAAIAAAAQFTRTVDDVSASITYAMDSGLEFSLWGRNLLDDRYLQQVFDSVAQPLSISGYTNQPRTWGGSVRFKW